MDEGNLGELSIQCDHIHIEPSGLVANDVMTQCQQKQPKDLCAFKEEKPENGLHMCL